MISKLKIKQECLVLLGAHILTLPNVGQSVSGRFPGRVRRLGPPAPPPGHRLPRVFFPRLRFRSQQGHGTRLLSSPKLRVKTENVLPSSPALLSDSLRGTWISLLSASNTENDVKAEPVSPRRRAQGLYCAALSVPFCGHPHVSEVDPARSDPSAVVWPLPSPPRAQGRSGSAWVCHSDLTRRALAARARWARAGAASRPGA